MTVARRKLADLCRKRWPGPRPPVQVSGLQTDLNSPYRRSPEVRVRLHYLKDKHRLSRQTDEDIIRSFRGSDRLIWNRGGNARGITEGSNVERRATGKSVPPTPKHVVIEPDDGGVVSAPEERQVRVRYLNARNGIGKGVDTLPGNEDHILRAPERLRRVKRRLIKNQITRWEGILVIASGYSDPLEQHP